MSKIEQIKRIIEANPMLSSSEIGKLVSLHRATVIWYLHKLNIYRDKETIRKCNNTRRGFEIEISENAEQVILGSILGDGMISKHKREENSSKNLNSRLVIQHTEPQKDYIEYKKNLLESFGLKCCEIKILKKRSY